MTVASLVVLTKQQQKEPDPKGKKNKPQTALNFVGLVGFAAPVIQHLNLKFTDFIL